MNMNGDVINRTEEKMKEETVARDAGSVSGDVL